MAIVNNIIANCESTQLSQQMISRQWDDKGTLIQFAGYPQPDNDEALIFRLIVWMKESEDAEPRELPPILLDADQWLVSNYYTQLVQTIKFQLCITNESGTFEKHSPIFAGHIGKSLSHNGQEGDIDVIPLFDPYKNYVDERVSELIVAAGDVQIDAALRTSGAAADAKTTGDAIAGVNGRLDDLKNAFNTTESGEVYNWEIGSLNPGYGTPLTSNTRIRSEYIRVTQNAVVTLGGEENRLIVYGYNLLKQYIQGSETTWTDGNKFTVPSGTDYIRILIRKTANNGVIVDEDIDGLVAQCSLFMPLPEGMNEYQDKFDTLSKGYSWYELVEEDNLSGSYINTTSGFRRNGTSISGYVTKVYDVTNINKCRFTGTPYRVFGKAEDGTLSILINSSVTNEVIDTSAFVKIMICGLQGNFWGANRIKLEGYTKIDSKWRNRKIVWFGTSIPAGGFKGEDNPLSYPFQVGRRLGATVYNEAVGDSGVHYRELSKVSATNPYGFNFYFVSASRCLTNTIAMMQWIGNWADYYCNGGTYKNSEAWDSSIFTSGLPTSWTDADTEAIKQFSYENKLDKYLTDDTCPDLFVFDHGYNDRIRWADNTGTYEAQLAEYGRDNCYTFRGAMNFLIDRIYAFKPTAKIVLIGDYEAQSDEKKYDSIYQQRVADDYGIPIFKRWEKTGWSQVKETINAIWNNGLLTVSSASATKTLLAWNLADGVHPHSDKSGGAIRHMTDLIVPFLESV